MKITLLNFFFLVLAVWRLSSLFANEEGPFDMFARIRNGVMLLRVRHPGVRLWVTLHKGLRCEWCSSVWFGTLAVAAWYYFGEVVLWFALPLALSAGAIAFKYLLHVLKNLDTYLFQMGAVRKATVDRSPDAIDAVRYLWMGMDRGKK